MRRQLHKDPAYQVVRWLTIGRMLIGVIVLPLCGWNDWWLLAALAFGIGFLSDMIDGELARAWGVTTAAGARLDSSADAALTFGALLAVTVGGGWHWAIIVVLTASFMALGPIESRRRGTALSVLIVAAPVVNLTLIGVLETRFLQLAGGSTAAIVSIEIAVCAVIGYAKRHRIRGFLRTAIARGRI